jgi:hypothetical protein
LLVSSEGALGAKKKAPLTFIAPVRTRRATFIARSGEAEMTAPERPEGESFAIRTAPSSSSKGMTKRTGPKILFLRDDHLVVDIGEERRLNVVSLRKLLGLAAAHHETRALGFALST